jgi:protein O-mannosyl-transferase
VSKKQSSKKTTSQNYEIGKHNLFWFCLILFAVPLLLYLKTLWFDFTYHDDDIIIIEGASSLQNFNFTDFFTTDAWLRKADIELYRPWQSITYAFDYRIGGVNPFIYHLHNVIVFSAGIVLLFFFLQQLNIPIFPSFVLSLFYSVHYLMSHAACWIPARGDIYLVFFALSTMILWIQWLKRKKIHFLVLSLLFFMFSLLAKESGIVLLAILFLFFCIYNQTDCKKILHWWWLLPYTAIVFVYLHLRKRAVFEIPLFDFQAFLYNIPTLPEEVFKFFIPMFYSVMPGFRQPVIIVGVLLIFLLAVVVFRRKNVDWKIIISGASIFLLPLLPSLFYKPTFAGVAYDYLDHRMFFCGIGLLLIVGELLKEYLSAANKKIQAVIFIVIAISAFITFHLADTYKNYENYYRNAMATNPASGLALANYSSLIFHKEHKYEEAILTLDKAIGMYPDNILFPYDKGLFAYIQQDLRTTNEVSDYMLKKWPGKYESYYMRANYYFLNKEFEKSIEYAAKSLDINSRFVDGYFAKGIAYKELGRFHEALSDLTMALKLNPGFANAYFNRGDIYGKMNKFSEALSDYRQYVALNPDDPLGYFYRGQAYCGTGNIKLGCTDLLKAKQMGLTDAEATIQRFCR